jgi:predicted small lipoprotein YifL
MLSASKAALVPIALLAAALTLAGCGRRGALEPPPGAPGASAQGSGSRLAPSPVGNPARQSAANRDPLSQPTRTGDVEEDEAPIPAPNRPFILDSLL